MTLTRRSNRPGVGRHSLGTTEAEEARRLLVELDLTMAVKYGKADASALGPARPHDLPLEEGRRLYMDFVGRARVAGGVRPSSRKRYRAVFDKFDKNAGGRGLTTWDQVTSQTLLDYAAHLEADDYAYRTLYLELTTLKQAILWMSKTGNLPADHRVDLPLEKAEGTDTYCWRPVEVRAMLEHCRAQPELAWLGAVLLGLAATGLRISELAGLRWSDIDLDGGTIRLVDETGSACRRGQKSKADARTLKSGRGRTFPIQDDLRPVLQVLPRHPDGAVFHGPRGGRLKPDVVRNVLIRDVLKPLAGRFPTPADEVGFADGRLHSFRHFFCSLCANCGVSQRVVMRWLGHRDSRMVEHYYHLHDEEARRQMDRIQLFDEGTGGRVAAGE